MMNEIGVYCENCKDFSVLGCGIKSDPDLYCVKGKIRRGKASLIKKDSDNIINKCAPEDADKKEVNKVLEKCKDLIAFDTSQIKSMSELEKENIKAQKSHIQNTMSLIKESVKRVAAEFVYIGFKLYETDKYHEYTCLGYDNISDFAFYELGFKKSTTYNFIRVYKRFACKLPGVNEYQVTQKYQDFSYSQLCEMLSLSDEQIETMKINPSDTVKQIREKKNSSVSDSECDLPEQEPDTQTQLITVIEHKRINVELQEDEAVVLLKLIEQAEISDSFDFESLHLLQELRTKLYIKADIKNVI